MKSVHPGEILEIEFLIPRSLSRHRVAKATHISPTTLSNIVKRKRNVTPEVALKLARYFGVSAAFWLNLQNQYDLEKAALEIKDSLSLIKPYNSTT